MKHGNESDVIELPCNTMNGAFQNWLNGEGKEMFIQDCQFIRDGDMEPSVYRMALKIAFMEGYQAHIQHEMDRIDEEIRELES